MKKWIKRSLIGLGSLVAILFIAAIAFVMLVDPNDYKPDLEAWVKDSTNLSLKIPGKLSWAFWPYWGISVSDLSLTSEENPEVPLELKKVSLQVSPWALLKGQLSSSIQCSADQLQYGAFLLKSIRFHGDGVGLDRAFPLTLSGRLDQGFPEPIDIDIKGTIFLSLKGSGRFELSDFNAKFNDSQITGQATVEDFKKPQMQASFNAPQFVVSDWVNLKGQKLFLHQASMKANLMLDGLSKTEVPSTLNGNIDLEIAELRLKGINLGFILKQIQSGVLAMMTGGISLAPSVVTSLSDFTQKDSKPLKAPSGDTLLGHFVMKSDVHSGRIETSQLSFDGENLKAKGQGFADLNLEQLNYQIDLYPLGTKDSYRVPFFVKGKLKDPDMGIDYSGLLSQVHVMIKDQIQQTLVGTVTKTLPQAADSIQGFVGNLLGKNKE